MTRSEHIALIRLAIDAETRRRLPNRLAVEREMGPAYMGPTRTCMDERRKTVAEMTPEQREKRRLRSWRYAEKKRRERDAVTA